MAGPAQNLARAFYEYLSDDGNTYQVATTQQNGTAQGATPATAGANPTYPRGWKMRHVYGLDSDGNRTKLPVFLPSDGIFLGITATFGKNTKTYTVEGKIGEDRFIKGAPGQAPS